MLHARAATALADWVRRATASGIREFQQFVAGIRRDHAAVVAALSVKWNNGPVEGVKSGERVVHDPG